FPYIRAEAIAHRMGTRMMGIVAEGAGGRVYLPPTDAMEAVARAAKPDWAPDVEFFQEALGFRIGNYGMTKWSDLFTPRQLVALGTFTDLIGEVRERVRRDALEAGLNNGATGPTQGNDGASGYADALAVLLSLVVSRVADWNNSLSRWESKAQVPQQLF